MEDSIKFLVFLAFVFLLLLLRLDAFRFGTAEYDDENASGGWRGLAPAPDLVRARRRARAARLPPLCAAHLAAAPGPRWRPPAGTHLRARVRRRRHARGLRVRVAALPALPAATGTPVPGCGHQRHRHGLHRRGALPRHRHGPADRLQLAAVPGARLPGHPLRRWPRGSAHQGGAGRCCCSPSASASSAAGWCWRPAASARRSSATRSRASRSSLPPGHAGQVRPPGWEPEEEAGYALPPRGWEFVGDEVDDPATGYGQVRPS